MSSPAVSSHPSGNLLRRFRRNRSASAAVEFALVAPVFFALLFAIIETATMFFASQVLETMTQNSSRFFLTGQAQTGQLVCLNAASQPAACNQTNFKNYVCNGAVMFDCTNLKIDVESYSAFTNVVINSQIDASGNFVDNMQYSPGNQGDIVVVRLFYPWPLFVTGLGYNISNMSGSKRLLSATAAFKNEPY